MTTFRKLWAALERKRPELSNPSSETTLTAANLKRLCEQMYDKGKEAGKEHADGPFSSMFGGR